MDAQETILLQLGEVKGLCIGIAAEQRALKGDLAGETAARAAALKPILERIDRLERQRAWLVGAACVAGYLINIVLPHVFK